MSTAQLIEKIERLPENLKKEVEEFIEAREQALALSGGGPYGIRLGLLKDKKLWISDDFDKPLEDFKDYM